MIEIKNYILNIMAACLICSVFVHLAKGLKASEAVIKMLCGIFIALTVFSPILQLRWNEVADYLDRMNEDAQTTVSEGTQLLFQQKSDGIQQRVQTYILDKASQYGCTVTAQVELSKEDPPIPIRVTLRGAVSPYQKTQLSEIIAADLGIPKEMQTWNAIN